MVISWFITSLCRTPLFPVDGSVAVKFSFYESMCLYEWVNALELHSILQQLTARLSSHQLYIG